MRTKLFQAFLSLSVLSLGAFAQPVSPSAKGSDDLDPSPLKPWCGIIAKHENKTLSGLLILVRAQFRRLCPTGEPFGQGFGRSSSQLRLPSSLFDAQRRILRAHRRRWLVEDPVLFGQHVCELD